MLPNPPFHLDRGRSAATRLQQVSDAIAQTFMLLFANFDFSRGARLLAPRVANLILIPTWAPGSLRMINLTNHPLTKLEDETFPNANGVKQLWAIGDPNQRWRYIPSRESQ